MLLKESGEYSSVDFIYFKFEGRTGLKAVPFKESGLVHIIAPVGLQPLNDVVVAGEQDYLARPAPPRFLQGRCADLCDLPVNNRGELVHDGKVGPLHHKAGKPGAEFLAVGKHREGPQPRGDIAQPDG